jgi:phosphatidate cytidylyltransferase
MTRLISGAALAAAALASILFLPPVALRVVACLVAALAAHEYLRIVGADDSYLGAVVIVTWLIAARNPYALPAAAVVTLFIGGLSALQSHRRTGQQSIAGAFSLLYVGMPLGMLAAINETRSWRATVLLIATVVVSDSLQYYTGRALGRRPLAPSISPKKTIEGAVGGVVAGTTFMAVAGRIVFPEHPVVLLTALGLVVSLMGIAGDLFESRLKRDAQLKDSSSLIPGHGGMLDRIDALLFVTPVFFVYVYWGGLG